MTDSSPEAVAGCMDVVKFLHLHLLLLLLEKLVLLTTRVVPVGRSTLTTSITVDHQCSFHSQCLRQLGDGSDNHGDVT